MMTTSWRPFEAVSGAYWKSNGREDEAVGNRIHGFGAKPLNGRHAPPSRPSEVGVGWMFFITIYNKLN
jgi:hypothetical protein